MNTKKIDRVAREWMSRRGFAEASPHAFYSDYLNEDLESSEEVAAMFDVVAARLQELAICYQNAAKEARR